MKKMFAFDPACYTAEYAAHEYVHIPGGLTEEYHSLVCRQIEDWQDRVLRHFAVGDKQQALYEFPSEEHRQEFLWCVGTLCGIDPAKLVVSERHIKSYEPNADPRPLVHKDRFATEISVGFSVRVPEESTLVLYPDVDREPNPFNSSTELRASLSPERVPERTLLGAPRVEIRDVPRDVIMFRGNSIWHMRERPANTLMLYFKLNSFHSDPLGEDDQTAAIREQTCRLLSAAEDELSATIPRLGRRVDCIQRRYNHLWQETMGAVLWGGKHYTINESQMLALRLMDGRRSLGEVLAEATCPAERPVLLRSLYDLAERGIVDLEPSRTANRGRSNPPR